MQISSKIEFYRLAMNGLCGNTPKMWNNHVSFLMELHNPSIINMADYNDIVLDSNIGIRFLKVGHKITTPRINVEDIGYFLRKNNINDGEYIITRVPSNQEIERDDTLQGEIKYFSNGELCLYYTNVYGYLREKLSKHGKHAFGLTAKMLMQKYLDYNSYEDIMCLLDMYKNSTIEFAFLPSGIKNFGIYKNRRTIIWEVRSKY